MADPTQSEVWWVSFDPVMGSEARKTRPALVISSPEFDHIPVRVVVPFTTWQPAFRTHQNKVRVAPSDENGLEVESAADLLHIRSVSLERFRFRAGVVDVAVLRSVLATVTVITQH